MQILKSLFMTPNLTTLNITIDTFVEDLTIFQELPTLPHLKRLSLTFDQGFVPELYNAAPNVTDLYMRVTCSYDHVEYVVPQISYLRKYANNLEKIDIIITCEYYAREFAALEFPNLKVLHISSSGKDQNVTFPMRQRHGLESLFLTGSMLKINLTGWTSLKKVCLKSFGKKVTNDEHQIWESLEELVTYDGIQIRNVKMPALRKLTLCYSTDISKLFSRINQIADHCPNIEELHIEKPQNLKAEEIVTTKSLFANLKKIIYF
jgi:hypothetical protein